ncbi:hypothetical protein EIP91_010483 [Steccherinum ochraceum]|uniref:DUF6534 domain-containing protein n=1 Tax=Steccherinum ochraceum TaxID=92696 RepID=A0A4R0RWY6_9APHY|nr:hypothetical protein EIP91_010483 [Steccherinum ochraceum]
MAAVPTIQELLGGYLVEAFVALGFYGIFVSQAYVYMLNCKGDPLYMRLCVGCITLLETFHTILIIHMTYAYLIDDFGNVAAIGGYIVWSGGASIACEMVIVGFCQSLYVLRVYVLSGGQLAWTSLISILLILRMAFGFATAALTFTLKSWVPFRVSQGPLITSTIGLSLSCLVDLLIALTLVYYLWKNKTGMERTDNILHALMAYFVNTGLLTMLCSMATMFTFVFIKSSLLFAGLVHMSSKLYANSLMGTLNARGILRDMNSAPRYTSATEPASFVSKFRTQPAASKPRHIEIFQQMSQTMATDDHVMVGRGPVAGKMTEFSRTSLGEGDSAKGATIA